MDEFREGVKLPPISADDAAVYNLLLGYISTFQGEAEFRQKLYNLGSSIAGTAVQYYAPLLPVRRQSSDLTDVERALGLAELRAARRAVAENPDVPDGYSALFEAYRNPLRPVRGNLAEQPPVARLEQVLQLQSSAYHHT